MEKYPKEFELYWRRSRLDQWASPIYKQAFYNAWSAGRRLEKRDNDIHAMRIYVGRELNQRITYSLNKLIGLTLAKVLPELKEEIDEAVAEILSGTRP